MKGILYKQDGELIITYNIIDEDGYMLDDIELHPKEAKLDSTKELIGKEVRFKCVIDCVEHCDGECVICKKGKRFAKLVTD